MMNVLQQSIARSRRAASGREQQPAVPLVFWVIVAGVGLVGLASPDPALGLVAALTLGILSWLLWRPGEPPVLLFACGYQWLQVCVPILAPGAEAPAVSSWGAGAGMEKAAWLSMAGLLVLAAGMRLGVGRWDAGRVSAFHAEVGRYSIPRLFAAYCVAFLFVALVRSYAFYVPRLAQIIVALAQVKWVLFFLLAYAVLHRRQAYALLWLAVAIEFTSGALSYFSGFKSVFFILLVTLLAFAGRMTLWQRLLVVKVAAFLLVTGLLWTAVKEDYREFLSQGARSQAVVVPLDARAGKLAELLARVDGRGFSEAWDKLVARLGYLTFFAQVADTVPESVPYQSGRLWKEAVMHVLMPRAFFPNKPAIEDSARTSEFTGVRVAGEEEGTSISIGYMGESYIDFGPVGMFAPVFCLGWVFGWIYRVFITRRRHTAFGVGAATAILVFGANSFEMSNIKMLGGTLMGLIVLVLFHKFAVPSLAAWLSGGGGRRRRAEDSRPAQARRPLTPPSERLGG